MADIFISYAHEDEARIRDLVRTLEEKGWSIFWDRRVPTGMTWQSYIGKALNDAKCVIVAWSHHSTISEYVLEEANLAKKRGVLLPVLWEAVDPPFGFTSIQAADLVSWDPAQSSPEFERLISDILIKVGPPPKYVKGQAAEVVAAGSDLRREVSESDRTIRESTQGDSPRRSPVGRGRAYKINVPLLVIVISLIGVLGVAAIRYRDRLFSLYTSERVKTNQEQPAKGHEKKDSPTDTEKQMVEVPLDKRALAISMINETGKPRSYTAVYTYGGDLGYGQSFASLKQGSLYTLLQTYSETQGARFATQIRPYLPQLERQDTSLIDNPAFSTLLTRVAGEDPIMITLQDESLEKSYLGPARRECADIGIQSALGFALVADTFLQSGRGRYEKIKLATIKALDGTPATSVNERRWLQHFAEERIASYSQSQFKAIVQSRTDKYIKLMDSNNWGLAAPISVSDFLIVDP